MTSSPRTYENTHSVDSQIGTPSLELTPVGAVILPVSPHRADENEQKRPVYADVFVVQLPSKEVKVPPVVDKKEEYAEVIGFKNSLVRFV